MKEYLTKLADEFEEDADTAYAYDKWHEAATLYRLALDLREKAQECVEPQELKVTKIRGANGEVYSVTSDSCTCMDYKFRGGPCKHMLNLEHGHYEPNGPLWYHVAQ